MIDTSKWSEAERAAYDAAEAELAAEETRLAEVIEAKEEALSSPLALIAGKKAEAQAKREQREREEREAKDDAAYTDACARLGGENRVARVKTLSGSIILRSPTMTEQDALEGIVAALKGHETDIATAVLDDTMGLIVYPPREDVDRIFAKYPAVRVTLLEARGVLAQGEAEIVQKKGSSLSKRRGNRRK